MKTLRTRWIPITVATFVVFLGFLVRSRRDTTIEKHPPSLVTLQPSMGKSDPGLADERVLLYQMMEYLVTSRKYTTCTHIRSQIHKKLIAITDAKYLSTCAEWTQKLTAPIFLEGWGNSNPSQKLSFLISPECNSDQCYLLVSALTTDILTQLIFLDTNGSLAKRFLAHVPIDLSKLLLQIDNATITKNPYWMALVKPKLGPDELGNTEVKTGTHLLDQTRVILATVGVQAALDKLNSNSHAISPTELGLNYAVIVEMACANKSPAELLDFVKNNIPAESLSVTIEYVTEIIGKNDEQSLVNLVELITDQEIFEKVTQRWHSSTKKGGVFHRWLATGNR